ncbi:MAG: bifunctional serine/threonine-protein kinase/formylglycine-generating enzyme family protein [Nevskiaceae bacterium]
MNTKQPFADLLAGLQAGKISLVDLIGSLNARGPVQTPLHKAELGMLDQALAGKKLDEKLHRLLTAKLKDVQVPKAVVEKTAGYAAFKPGAGSEDQTVAAGMGGGGDKTRLNPGAAAGGDKTVINPGGDKTVINPGGSGGGSNGDGFDLLIDQGGDSESTEMADPQATTGFKPSEPATARSRTSGTSGPSTSSWNRAAASGAPEREVHSGDVLKDRFLLDKELGRGGMGIVFKAKDERKVEAQDKNPWVAVKVLNPEFRKHPQALVALQRESRKAQQLTHDNILRVYDFDKDGTVIYMTMEYVDGGSLKDVIKKHPTGMSWDKGWPVIAGLARGLGRAHRDNIVHSDFKPGNVMMTSDMIPKLFDMGIARAAKSGAEGKGETTVFDAGELGALTPAYASLEMIEGESPELIDDIYALGITAYEILTGKHPFNKKNAQEVMKAGMKPPVVAGLQRGQQKTLQRSVAFRRADRVKSCDDFLEGMRPHSIKDYAVQLSVGGVVAILLLVGVFGGLLPFLAGERVDAMIAQFAQNQFTDYPAAVAALDAMKPTERDTAMQKGSKEIQNYFFTIANDKWKVLFSAGKWDRVAKEQHFDHPAALTVVNAVKALYPDSAAVADNLRRLDEQKKTLIAELNDDFTGHIDANRIYEDKTPNVVETVAIVRQIDPANDLLQDKKLNGRYTTDVRNALETGQFEAAAKRAATAIKVFPNDTDLAKLSANVKQGYEMQLAAAKQRELMAKMTAAEAKTELAKLASNPLFTPDWQVGVNASMSKLTGDTTPDTMKVKNSLADAYAKQLASKVDAKDIVGGQMVAENSKMFTGMPNLMRELGRLTEARKAQEKEEASKAALAEADTLKRTLKTKADANDLKGAQVALDKLRGYLPANDPFLSGDGPKSLGEAYLRQANRQAEQGRYDAALKFAQDGLKAAPGLASLKQAEGTFRLEGNAQTVSTAAGDPTSASADKIKAALEVVRVADANRYAKVYNDAQTTVISRLTALAQTDPAATKKAKDEWLKVFPQNTQLSGLVIPEAKAATTTAAASSGATSSLPSEARRARRSPGVDTCSPSFSTFGKSSRATCQDDVNGQPGPKLVVIPNPSGGYLAITKFEITAGQFNAFCAATGKCKAQGGSDGLPRTNINLATAKAYAAWLSDQTGFNYRLPTDAEWTQAAGAGGAGAGDVSGFNCVVMSGGSQIKGGFAVSAATGSSNAWGLVNAVGNAAEYTDGGSVRGGHFNVPTSRCAVDLREGGGENDTVGLRLVREMG